MQYLISVIDGSSPAPGRSAIKDEETALDAFVQMDESGAILSWNSQAERIFGWPRKEVLGNWFALGIMAIFYCTGTLNIHSGQVGVNYHF